MTSTTGTGRAVDGPGGVAARRWWALGLALWLLAGAAAGCSDDSEAGSGPPPPAGDTDTGTGTGTGIDTDDAETDTGTTDEADSGTETTEDTETTDDTEDGEEDGEPVAEGLDLPAEEIPVGTAAPVTGFAGARWTVTIEAVDTTSTTDPTGQPCAVVSGELTLDALADDRGTSSPGDLPVRFLLDTDDRELRLGPFCEPEALIEEDHQPMADLQVDVGETIRFYDSYDLNEQVPAAYVMGGGADDGWVTFAVG